MGNVQIIEYPLDCPCCNGTVVTSSGCFVREINNWITLKRDLLSATTSMATKLEKKDIKIEELENEVIKLRNQIAWCLENGALKTVRDHGSTDNPVIIWGSRGVEVPILNKSFTSAVAYAMRSE